MQPNLARPLAFLSSEQLSTLHQAVLTVLWEVGVRVMWEPALEVFAGGGCRVDFDSQVVHISEQVLMRALASAPASFTLHGVCAENDIHVDLDKVYTIAGSSAIYVLDLDGQHRPARLADLADLTRLVDALEMADIMHAAVVPQEINQVGFDRILFSTIFQNTTKHYYSQGQGKGSVSDQVEMAAVIQGSTRTVMEKPCFSLVVCLTSPLVHVPERVQEMMDCARYHIPIWLEATNMMGATGPVTIAGALVEQTANVLASLVLMQLLAPGHPCIFSIASGGLNMRTATYVAASPEAVLLHCATAQIAHFYHLPFQGCSGLDSCLPDAQAGYERMLQAAPLALAGANFIHLAFGMMDQLLTSSYEQAVIDNEIFHAAFRLAEGIQVTPETIALDQIRAAGPGGQFLDQEYTLMNYRQHQWQPKLTNRLAWDEWQRQTGGKDMRQRANELARQILAEHHPSPLSAAQEAELNQMARSFQERVIRKTGS
ncbi:MAG: trimethylamine methyltransferase family protein [Omnitrophica WOR_2 bacterium]